MATRSQLRTDVLDLADANGSGRWNTTAGGSGEVDRRLGMVHMREWRRILNAAPYYRFAKRTPTFDSSGKVAITHASMGTYTGDSQERVFRILLLSVNNTPYEFVEAKRYVLATANGESLRCWYREGDNIVVPDAANLTATGVWVNHLPTRFDQLSGDGVSVTLPDDYDDIFVYEGAGELLMKGGAESGTSGEFFGMARRLRDDMLSDLARISGNPMGFEYPDSRHEWGG